MKIALVIGHRKNSKGAVGSLGISEFDFNRQLIDEVLSDERLQDSNNSFRVFYRKNTLSGYTERMKDLHKRIDSWGASVSVSLHFNASSNNYVDGHEVLYYSKGGEYYATQMNNLFTYNLANKDRGIKIRDKNQRGGGFLSRGRSKCILVEPFFASHQHLYDVGKKGRKALKNAFVDFLVEKLDLK